MEQADLADGRRRLRHAIYWILGILTLGQMTAHIFKAERVYEPSFPRPWPSVRPEPMPTFSSNDRSRWATVRALVDEGTFVIGRREVDPEKYPEKGYADFGIVFEDGWQTVDKVLHPERLEFLSSKPPLLPFLLAGEYWLLKYLFGLDIVQDRWIVIPLIVWTVNALPFAVFLACLAQLIEQYGRTDWGRVLVYATACLGTFLTTFANTLNNHTPAACCVMVAVWAVTTGPAGPLAWWRLALAGFCAGFCVTLELPAASFAVLLGAILLLVRWRGVLTAYVPALVVPVAALLALNYASAGMVTPVYEKFGTIWYEYEGSHWRPAPPGSPPKRGIDFANDPKPIYAFHATFGHHGLFSLTPVWLLAVGGALAWLVRRGGDASTRWLGGGTLLLLVVVMGFYIFKTNNYGGFTSGLRWVFWLTPLLLLTTLPAADWLGQSRLGRAVCMVCLGVSAFSSAWPVWNPWRQPWLYELLTYTGWIDYG